APATTTTTPATTTTTPATTTPVATTPTTTTTTATPAAPKTPPTTATPTIAKATSHAASAAERLDAVMKRIASHATSVEPLPNGAKLYHLAGGRVVEQVEGHSPYVVKAGSWAKHPAAKKA